MSRHKISRKGLYLRRTIAVLFFALTLLMASLRSGPLVYALLYLSVLLPLLSAKYTNYVYKRLCIVQLIRNHTAIKGQPVNYACRLVNETSSAFTQISIYPSVRLDQISSRTPARFVVTLSPLN